MALVVPCRSDASGCKKSWDNRKLIYVVKQSRHAYLLVISSLSKSFVKRSDRSIDGGVSLENLSALKFFLKRKTLKRLLQHVIFFKWKPSEIKELPLYRYWTSGMPHFGSPPQLELAWSCCTKLGQSACHAEDLPEAVLRGVYAHVSRTLALANFLWKYRRFAQQSWYTTWRWHLCDVVHAHNAVSYTHLRAHETR